MQHRPRPSMNRRRLFGIGAAAGAAVATGASATTAFAGGGDGSAGAGGFAPADGGQPNIVNPVAVTPGVSVMAIGYSSFVAAGNAGGSSVLFASPASVGNSAETGWVHAPIVLPAGSRIVKVDVVGYRVSPGTQTWNLYKTNLQTTIGLVSLGTVVTNSSQAEVQGSIPLLGGGVVVGVGDSLHLELQNATATSRAVGALVQYYPAGGTFSPIAPKRVYDSRRDPAGKIGKGQVRNIALINELAPGTATNVVPVGTRAVAYNVTITDTEGTAGGYLTIVPTGDPTGGPSSINWDSAKQTVANGQLVGVSANREITVLCEGYPTSKTHFVIDVTGYFL